MTDNCDPYPNHYTNAYDQATSEAYVLVLSAFKRLTPFLCEECALDVLDTAVLNVANRESDREDDLIVFVPPGSESVINWEASLEKLLNETL